MFDHVEAFITALILRTISDDAAHTSLRLTVKLLQRLTYVSQTQIKVALASQFHVEGSEDFARGRTSIIIGAISRSLAMGHPKNTSETQRPCRRVWVVYRQALPQLLVSVYPLRQTPLALPPSTYTSILSFSASHKSTLR